MPGLRCWGWRVGSSDRPNTPLMHHPRRPSDAGARRPIRWLSFVALAFWPLLASTAPLGHGNLGHMEKLLNGKLAPSPEGSEFVQVREHIVLGYRVTEVVLGRASIDDTLPLVVQFHGRGDHPHIPGGDHANREPARLMLPWAPQKLGDGFTWFPLSVTERDKDPKVLGHYIRERSDEFAKVLEVFQTRRPTEGRALVSGFSQGGMMSFALALRHPERIDGAFPVAGWLPDHLVRESLDPKRPSHHPPIRALHGRGDPIVPAEPTMALVDDLRERGLDVTLEVFAWDEHSMNEEMHARHTALVLERIRARREGESPLVTRPPTLG